MFKKKMDVLAIKQIILYLLQNVYILLISNNNKYDKYVQWRIWRDLSLLTFFFVIKHVEALCIVIQIPLY